MRNAKENVIMATGSVIQLPHVRLSFPRLFVPRAFREGQKKRYEATFLLDPTHPVHAKQIKVIQKNAEDLIKEVCKGKVPSDVVYCFGDGDDKEYDGYAGMFRIATNKKEEEGRPTVVTKDGTPVHGPNEDQCPYPGCYVDATITLWSMNDSQYGRKLNANLRAVRFCQDGEAFSSIKPVSDDEFEDFGDDFGEAADPLES
jgi:hypothetical protein